MSRKGDKEKRREQTRKAVESRQQTAKEHDVILERYIKENPGLTYIQLEKIFGEGEHQFKRTYLKNAIIRLESKNKIFGRTSTSREGKIVKNYFANYRGKEIAEIKRDTIKIPVELLTNPKDWKSNAYVYAVKNNEIRISPKRNSDLERDCFFSKNIVVEIKDDYLVIKLPSAIVKHYELDYDNYYRELENGLIKLIITPKIPKKKTKEIKTILLLEDSEYWSDAFEKIFINAGFEVFPASTMEAAKKIIQTQQIDYYILDDEIKFKKEAVKFFVNIKKKNKKVYGVFITAYPVTDEKRNYLTELGFLSIIEKKSDQKAREPEEVAREQLVRLKAVS